MGAKFSSGSGATVFYDDGPITAPSGEQGTQRTEFEAKIKSITSSTTVGAVFLYDTRSDSDGGAWRKKARGSWYYETLNTATRGGRREFPSVALIVADGASPDTVSLYDLDDPAAPLWLQFKRGTASWTAGNMGLTDNNVSSVFALNGRIYIGQAAGSALGVEEISFVEDTGYRYTASATAGGYYNGNISERLDGKGWAGSHSRGNIVNGTVNDVAATVLEGAEIGALGLPEVTIGVATDGGVSVIHGGSGAVYDQTKTISSTVNSYDVAWGDNGDLFWSSRAISSKGTYVLWLRNTLYADSSATPDALYYPTGIVGGNDVQYLGSSSPYCNDFKTTKDGLAVGSSHGLSIIKQNNANPNDGAVAYVTSSYNTGYLLGDIRGAFLMGDRTADRSVKGNTLTLNQASGSDTVDAERVDGASGTADLYGYKSFSASNYLSKANDTDFDFGTGDFSIMFWLKTTNASSAEDYVSRADSSPEAGDFTILKNGSNKLNFYIRDSGWTLCGESTSNIGYDWQQVIVARSGTRVSVYINGVREGGGTHSLTMTPSGGSEFRIGNRADNTAQAAAGASLSLLRISATAPTPQQVKDIYEAEKPLFRAGAKCLLQSDDASPNVVNDLSYDASTDLLHVFQNGDTVGENLFRGLEVVESRGRKSNGWTYSSASHGASAGGVSASARSLSGGGVIADLPAIDVRGDINTADTKLPDDGKFHFSGVTTPTVGATPTVIGNIPIAENERYKVSLIASGETWPPQAGHWIDVTMEETFFRKVGDNVVARGEASKLTNESLASMDINLIVDTGANTIQVQVTGVASTRVAWNATVEVQRVASEKQYER